MLIIDLTLCSANSDGAIHHGGGQYGYSAARYVAGKSSKEVAVLVQPGFDIRKIGLDLNRVRVIEKKSNNFPFDYDRSENIFFLPLPYTYIENDTLPKRARVWATVHGLRSLELARLLSQSVPIQLIEIRQGFVAIADLFHRWIRHKLRNIYYENELKKIALYRDFISKGNSILTVSEHSKWSLELHGVVGSKLNPIHVAYPLHPFEESSHVLPSASTDSRRGLLFVSAERKGKNFIKFLESIEKNPVFRNVVKREGLILTGQSNIISGLTKKFVDIDVEMLGYCSDFDLQNAFRKASVLVYPSINEGFGIPPVHAFRNGIPVLASPVTSIAEICGDAAVYANPFDHGEIASRLLMLLNSPEICLAKVEKGYLRYEELRIKAYRDWDLFLQIEGFI